MPLDLEALERIATIARPFNATGTVATPLLNDEEVRIVFYAIPDVIEMARKSERRAAAILAGVATITTLVKCLQQADDLLPEDARTTFRERVREVAAIVDTMTDAAKAEG